MDVILAISIKRYSQTGGDRMLIMRSRKGTHVDLNQSFSAVVRSSRDWSDSGTVSAARELIT